MKPIGENYKLVDNNKIIPTIGLATKITLASWNLVNSNTGRATIILLTFSILNLYVQWLWQWIPEFVGFEIGIAILTVAVPVIIKIIDCSLKSISVPLAVITGQQERDTYKWINIQMLLQHGIGPLVSGLILVAIGVYTTIYFWIPWDGWIGLLFLTWLGMFFFSYGMLSWVYGVLIIYITKFTSLKIAPKVFSWPVHAIRQIYDVYFKLFLIGTILYLVAVLAVWGSPEGESIAFSSNLGKLWVFPPALMIICFFFYFHYRTHYLLKRYRQFSELELLKLAETVFEEWRQKPQEPHANIIDQLLKWRNEIAHIPSLPLDLKAIIITLSTLLLPTLKAILDIMK